MLLIVILYQKVYCSSSMDYKVIPSFIIFLFGAWYIDSAARGWVFHVLHTFILEQILVSHGDDETQLKRDSHTNRGVAVRRK